MATRKKVAATVNADPRVAIYARVSTKDQNCEMQLRECRAYAKSRGWTVAREYVEKRSTRKKRPELEQLMKDAESKKLDCIVTWKLDRFGRSLVDIETRIEELKRLECRYIACTQGIDTANMDAQGKFLLQILAAGAELERELARERTIAGVANARANGKKLGRVPSVYSGAEIREMQRSGKAFEREGRLVIARQNHPGEYIGIVDRDEVWRRHKAGESVREIAKQVGTSKQTIFRIVRGDVAPDRAA